MLSDALDSVTDQLPVACEHLVVDGGSIDGSQAVASASGAHVIDARASSIYQAINIGIAHASGDIIGLLNSDDRLAPGALAAVQAAFAATPSLDLVRGQASIEHLVGNTWLDITNECNQPTPHLRQVLLGAPNINACFFRRDLARRIGPFDPRYAISADREWLARALLNGALVAGLAAKVYIYRAHRGSITIGQNKPATTKWVREHLTFSRILMTGNSLAAPDRATLLDFHAKESTRLLALILGGKAPLGSATELVRSFLASPLWPIHAIRILAGHLCGKGR